MAPRFDICVGLNRGFRTTKIPSGKPGGDKKYKVRPARVKGVSDCFIFTNKFNIS